MMAMTVTALVTVVLGGLAMAVQMAREHARGLEEATLQAQAATDRIGFMVEHTGTYRTTGATRIGLAVVSTKDGFLAPPDVLVVWSGGRNGGMAAAGLQARLPQAHELVVYAPHPDRPHELVEMAFPGVQTAVDFDDPLFQTTIRSLLASKSAEAVTLVDRLRVTSGFTSFFRGSSTIRYGAARFELTVSPEDSSLASVAPGTPEWYALPWAQSIVAGRSGLRQGTVNVELQLEPWSQRAEQASESQTTAVPYFGCVSVRHVYEP
ncbi:MAG: hypothetical protein KY476_08255 [Planctomycetes bacterium]|nr:hypothetical protein [Planctomycetota bacterium]